MPKVKEKVLTNWKGVLSSRETYDHAGARLCSIRVVDVDVFVLGRSR